MNGVLRHVDSSTQSRLVEYFTNLRRSESFKIAFIRYIIRKDIRAKPLSLQYLIIYKSKALFGLFPGMFNNIFKQYPVFHAIEWQPLTRRSSNPIFKSKIQLYTRIIRFRYKIKRGMSFLSALTSYSFCKLQYNNK